MRQWTVDAFADRPFMGNPACVVEPFDAWPDAGWMQALAQENNQAETAFLLDTGQTGRWGLRWFTPGREVPLCGHATLAAAHVLRTELGRALPAVFDTLSGELTVAAADDGYEMDFPGEVPTPAATPEGLAKALGAEPVEVLRATYLIAVLKDEATVRGLEPDIPALLPIAKAATPGFGDVVVCAEADPGRPYEVVSRFFGPGSGVPEDPATGSAHCILGPMWAERRKRPAVTFHQAFPGRGGDLRTEIRGDRVLIRGRAVTVLESRLRTKPAP